MARAYRLSARSILGHFLPTRLLYWKNKKVLLTLKLVDGLGERALAGAGFMVTSFLQVMDP